MIEETLTLSKQEKEEENNEEDSSSRWSQLLPELLTRISLLVFRGGDVGALAVISSVCQSWYKSLEIYHIASLIRTTLSDPPLDALPPEYPCLMILKGSSCKFYHPNHVFTMNFPELSGSCIQFSKFGWLLLRRFYTNNDGLYTYFFFNPFTREKIELPPADDHGFVKMCFSAPPTCSNCYVIGHDYFSGYFGIIRRGEQKWTFYGPFKTQLEEVLSHLVLFRRHCYVIRPENKLASFDVKKKVLNLLGRPFPSLADDDDADNASSKFLVSDGAQLFSVIVSREEQEVSIAMRNEQERLWIDSSTNLGNRMLFVSKTSCLLKPAPVKASSNKVYFPKILHDDSFVTYCLATRKYISFLGDYYDCNPFNRHIKEWYNCKWI